MKKTTIHFASTLLAFSVYSLPSLGGSEGLTSYVNPFVGTDGYGNVYPGAQLPFGGIQISPDTDEHFYDCASGYGTASRYKASR